MALTNKDIGNLGEELACNLLLDKGYNILHRNYTTRIGEIDIIAYKDNTLLFCEVKTTIGKGSWDPLERIGEKKKRILLQSILLYMYNNANDYRVVAMGVCINTAYTHASIDVVEVV